MNNFVSTHWGTYKVSNNNDENLNIEQWALDPNPSEFGFGLGEAAKSHLRIDQPYVRKKWLKNKNNTEKIRGLDDFVAISWDEVTDLVASELLNIKNDFGNKSIYEGSYS